MKVMYEILNLFCMRLIRRILCFKIKVIRWNLRLEFVYKKILVIDCVLDSLISSYEL